MLQNNYLIIILFLLSQFVIAQPGSTKVYFQGNFIIKECRKNNLSFETRDSVNFYSNKNSLHFRIYDYSKKDPENTKNYIKLGADKFYLFNTVNNNEFFIKNLISLSINGSIIDQKITAIEIKQKDTRMLILFDFINSKKNQDQFK